MKSNIKGIIIAVFAALFFTVEYKIGGANGIFGYGIDWVLYFALFFILVKKEYDKKQERRWLIVLLSSFFSFMWVLSIGYINSDSASFLIKDSVSVFKTALLFLGGTSFSYICLSLLNHLLDYEGKIIKTESNKVFFLLCMGIITLCWIPHIIICYPGYSYSDTWSEVSQYFGQWSFSAGHPPFYTVIIGLFIRLGMKIGNPNVGFYLYIIVQSIYALSVISYSLLLLKKLKAPKWLIIVNLIVVCLSPYYINFTCFMIKDFPFAISVLLLITELIFAMSDTESFVKEKRHLIITPIAVIGTMLIRHNGKFLVISLLVVLIVPVLKNIKLLGKKGIIIISSIVIIPIALSFVINAALIKKYNISERSIAESLCMPLQQTSRYCKYHGSELTDYERDVIASVVYYDGFVENYTDWTVDPVKNQWHGTKEQVPEFLMVWAKMFIKHPFTYIEASMDQNWQIYYPYWKISNINTSFFSSDGQRERMGELNIIEENIFNNQKDILNKWYNIVLELPVIGLLSNPATYNLLILALCIFAIAKKRYKVLIPLLPAFISTLLFIGPEIQVRYALPFMYPVFILAGYYISAGYMTNSNYAEEMQHGGNSDVKQQ